MDQRTTALDQPEPVRRLLQPAPGARRGRERGRGAAAVPGSSPDETDRDRRDAEPGRLHLRLLRGGLLLRRAVQPGGRRQPRSSAQPQTTDGDLRAALAQFDSALAQPGLAGTTARSPTSRGRDGRARCSISAGSPRRRGRGGGADRVPVRHRARRSAAAAAERDLRRTPTRGCGRWRIRRGARGCPIITRAKTRAVPWIASTTTETASRTWPRQPDAQYILFKYPDADAPVPVADGIEARLIEAEARAPERRTLGGMTDHPQRPAAERHRLDAAAEPATPGTAAAADLLFSRAGVLALRHRPPPGRHAAADPAVRPARWTRVPHGDYHKGGSATAPT